MELNKIAEGWKNHLFPSRDEVGFIEFISGERLKICRECSEHSSKHFTIRPDEHCTNCTCPLITKTKCLSCECPIKKWLAIPNE